MSEKYDIGDIIELRAAFTVQSEPTDPDDVSIRVRRPSGFREDVTATSEVEGIWTATYEPTKPGRYWWRAEGTTPAQGAAERSFEVRTQHVQP